MRGVIVATFLHYQLKNIQDAREISLNNLIFIHIFLIFVWAIHTKKTFEFSPVQPYTE